MFKNTSEALNHVRRVASASTRERPSGRMDMVPEWAHEPEEYYNSIHEQWKQSIEVVNDTQKKLSDIKFRLKQTLPHNEFVHLENERCRLAELIVDLQKRTIDLRLLARAAAQNAWFTVFYHAAHTVLDREMFQKITEECRNIIGREISDNISKAHGERTEEHRQHQMRRKNFKLSLKNLQKNDRVVYSTDGGYRGA